MRKPLAGVALRVVAVVSAGMAYGSEIGGELTCEVYKQFEPCESRWSFDSNGYDSLQLLRWDRHSVSWIREADLPTEANKEASNILKQGAIYRIVACSGGKDCVSSNSIWSPVWRAPEETPASVEVQLPNEIAIMDVEAIRDDGVHGPAYQAAQYNVYLLYREIGYSPEALVDFPAMLPPAMQGEAPVSLEEQAAYNAFDFFENNRLRAIEFSRTGAVKPE